jgi:hypothetical protein
MPGVAPSIWSKEWPWRENRRGSASKNGKSVPTPAEPIKRDSEQDQCETKQRRKCLTAISTTNAAKPSVVPFAKEGLASFVTTARERPSVRGNASITSGHGGRATVDGCGNFRTPDLRSDAVAPVVAVQAQNQRRKAGWCLRRVLLRTPG